MASSFEGFGLLQFLLQILFKLYNGGGGNFILKEGNWNKVNFVVKILNKAALSLHSFTVGYTGNVFLMPKITGES